MKKYLFVLAAIMSMNARGQGFAVIELFTSQGCSSCPAADRNLSEILQEAEKNKENVYGLSFHVDYWNYIGWKDPYSSKEFTERQKLYASQLGLNSIYTPQMIVNGRTEFVGSSKGDAGKSVASALNRKPSLVMTISEIVPSENKIKLTYSVDRDPTDEILNIALVEKEVENYVPKGENTGKKLHHDNVVRVFKSVPLQRRGNVELSVSDIDKDKLLVIAYVQDKQFNVVAATARKIE